MTHTPSPHPITSAPRLTAAKILACFIFTAFALPSHAQTCGANAQSTIATDRPQITNSSIVVPCGSLQFENGLQATGSGGQHIVDLPETSIRLGIAARTELRSSTPNYLHNDVPGTAGAGISDTTLGFKQQLGPVHGFELSLVPTLSLPTGSDALSSHGYDPTLQLPWSRPLGKLWTVAGQFGVISPTQSGRRNLSGQASLYFDRQLTSLLDAYFEYSGAFPQRGSPVHAVDFGAAFKPSSHQQFDVHYGVGLSSSAADYSVGIGYSVRFQLTRPRTQPH